MNYVKSGLLLAVIQLLIVCSLGGKLLYDRTQLPRVWVKTVPVDPDLPIRGRYVRLAIVVEAVDFSQESLLENVVRGVFVLRGDKLVAKPATVDATDSFRLSQGDGAIWAQPMRRLAFFIPEHVPDPSIRQDGEELWVEVTVTSGGKLRPIRLGVYDGRLLTPLGL